MADITGNDGPLLELALFAGAGGGILGGKLLGWRTVCAVEINAYAASVLIARQNDGCLEPFPVWDDVTTFDGTRWRGRVDVVSGGFPCQDISVAGKGAGIDGERSGLWSEFARIIREVRPRFAFVENSPALAGRGLDRVLGNLAEMGFDATWGVLGASDVGLPHYRKRIWILANSNSNGRQERVNVPGTCRTEDECQHAGRASVGVAASEDDSNSQRMSGTFWGAIRRVGRQREYLSRDRVWKIEDQPTLERADHGMANRLDQLRAIGNGQVPAVAATAWRILSGQ